MGPDVSRDRGLHAQPVSCAVDSLPVTELTEHGLCRFATVGEHLVDNLFLLSGKGQRASDFDDGVFFPDLQAGLEKATAVRDGVELEKFFQGLKDQPLVESRLKWRLGEQVVFREKGLLSGSLDAVRRHQLRVGDRRVQHCQLRLLGIGVLRNHLHRGDPHKVLRIVEQLGDLGEVR